MISPRDLCREGSTDWVTNNSYVGRADILDAMKMWGESQQIIKGIEFANCVGQLQNIWEVADDSFANYHNGYIHFQTEAFISLCY